ncbi:hypothetical protein [Jatrophihabitans sp. GAS493]|uniref:hypothetical protein n=1 Tax=Jatrophihabitans sp. GAS493 TaxID=1907575 RepID=UPI000BB78913|nr:hypothetical protein [Jatrophihabitans sp. GAS493]
MSVALLSACASGERATPSGSAAASRQSDDSNTAKILRLVAEAGVVNGDPKPTAISWAYASRGAIAKTLEFGVPDGEDEIQQVLIVAHGNFTATAARLPPGATAPTGTVIELVYDTATWVATDFGLAKTAPDLSALGQVFTPSG